MTKDSKNTLKFLATEEGTQLISAIKKMSEGYDALATFFEKFTPGLYNAALGVAENSVHAEEQLGDDKKKRKRRTKDPNAPKQPMSSYLIFSQKFRSQVKEEHPELAPKDVASELGRMWREMSEEDKQVYMEEAVALREEYQSLNTEYKKHKGEGIATDDVSAAEIKEVEVEEEDEELPAGSDSDEDSASQDSSDREEDEASEQDEPVIVAATEVKKAKSSKKAPVAVPPVKEYESEVSSDEEEEVIAAPVVAPLKKKVPKKVIVVEALAAEKSSTPATVPSTHKLKMISSEKKGSSSAPSSAPKKKKILAPSNIAPAAAVGKNKVKS